MKLRSTLSSQLTWLAIFCGMRLYDVVGRKEPLFNGTFWIELVVIAALCIADYLLSYMTLENGRIKGRNGLLFIPVDASVSDIEKIEYKKGMVTSLVLTIKGKEKTFIEMKDMDKMADRLREMTGLK